MPRALCLLPDGPNYRRADFCAGLTAAGFELVDQLQAPERGDLVVTWNRTAWRNEVAQHFEAAGVLVLVAENGYLGKNWLDRKWFALAQGHHAGAGRWRHGGAVRWDSWRVQMADWKRGGRETVIFAQRGIGEPSIASPWAWAEQVQAQIGGRVRQHPGAQTPAVPLADDLRLARAAVTWNSAAALHALLLGVPVWHGFDRWIGAGAARPLANFGGPGRKDDAARLETFRRLSWAMWDADEVKSGRAFEHHIAG